MTATSLLTLSTENRPELCRLFWRVTDAPWRGSSEPSPHHIADALNALSDEWDIAIEHWKEQEPPYSVNMVHGGSSGFEVNDPDRFAALTTAVMIAVVLNAQVLNEGEGK